MSDLWVHHNLSLCRVFPGHWTSVLMSGDLVSVLFVIQIQVRIYWISWQRPTTLLCSFGSVKIWNFVSALQMNFCSQTAWFLLCCVVVRMAGWKSLSVSPPPSDLMSLYTTKTDTPQFRLNNGDASELLFPSPSQQGDDVTDSHVAPTCRQDNLKQCLDNLNQVHCSFDSI